MKKTSNSIIQQLQVVFTFSILLLIFSLLASYYSIQKLITNSMLVNHTNQVLIEAENIISHLKDAETGQRGYLLTAEDEFLDPYNGAYRLTSESYNKLSELTSDNPMQQKNLREIKALYEAKFGQMEVLITATKRKGITTLDPEMQLREMTRGKKMMDDLRLLVNRVKTLENEMLTERLNQQQIYIDLTPIILSVAALVSILISFFAYIRIKRDMDRRIAQQEIEEQQYRLTNHRIAAMESVTKEVAAGNYATRSTDEGEDDLGRISSALNVMTNSLEQTFTDLQTRSWLQTGTVLLADAMRGERVLKTLANKLIQTLSEYVKAPVGLMYVIDADYNYILTANYGVTDAPAAVIPGQGVNGKVIENHKMLLIKDVPADYLKITSSLGNTAPRCIAIIPLVFGRECIGIIELGFLSEPDELTVNFLETNLEPMSIGVNGALDFVRLQNFLEETQAQAEELQTQHNELENLNAELEAQAQKLQASEEELRVQQEELQQTNEELEERSSLLEEKNLEIVKKAEELEISTRYKSEFLANMSHELRTPLNSILLLSRLLSENEEHNLTDEQVEYASVIRSSGNGLLGLIDEILDLSKIEAGKMDLEYMSISVNDLTHELASLFDPVAKNKGLNFETYVAPDIDPVIETDKMRLEQILKNLISNALKFTAQGAVRLAIEPVTDAPQMLAFSVSDTGIGIEPEKQKLIFEAFQQADGSTKRKYGGTGLGLSISRELIKLLGGEIRVNSVVGKGSRFTVLLPVTSSAAAVSKEQNRFPAPEPQETPQSEKPKEVSKYLSLVIPEAIPDDRTSVDDGDRVILIVEDDTAFAKSLLDYTRKKGYKGIVTVRGDEALPLAERFMPLGILLDVQLPVRSGWEVMDELKNNPLTRPIPVHMMSSHHVKNESLLKGAVDFIDKPFAIEKMQDIFSKIEYVMDKKSKKVLIVEDNPQHAKALAYYLGTYNINSELKSSITEGIEALRGNEVDCVILDMGIPDRKAYDILEEARKNPEFENVPIIIFTGKSLSMTEEHRIKQYANSIVVKTAHSYQRMLDEVSLFLHMVEENAKSGSKSNSFRKLGGLTQILAEKTVLIADDDVRNIFSLSKSLENHKMKVITALDGKEALQKLYEHPEVDVVLLDMMMPQMDGYETARRIRENDKWRDLPVIAVTAKAMTGDREKCINAGASDYITKPVDVDQLMSLLRVWLYEKY